MHLLRSRFTGWCPNRLRTVRLDLHYVKPNNHNTEEDSSDALFARALGDQPAIPYSVWELVTAF